MANIPPNPTQLQHEALQNAYDYFNEQLFFKKLPPCLLTIFNTFGKSRIGGFASPSRWTYEKGTENTTVHQIAITTQGFKGTAKNIFSILVHEMVHVWQFEFGTPGKYKYHTKEWVFKMKEVGLVPISANGKGTGERVWHAVEEGGRFDKAFENIPKTYLLPFTSFTGKKEPISLSDTPINKHKDKHTPTTRNRNKRTYLCTGCKTKIWAKPDLTTIRCDTCDQLFEELPPKEKG